MACGLGIFKLRGVLSGDHDYGAYGTWACFRLGGSFDAQEFGIQVLGVPATGSSASRNRQAYSSS